MGFLGFIGFGFALTSEITQQIATATKLHIYSQNISWEIKNLSRWMKENRTSDPHSKLFAKKQGYIVPELSKKKGAKAPRELIMEGDCGKFMKGKGFKIGCHENTLETFQHVIGKHVSGDQVVVFTQENQIGGGINSDLQHAASHAGVTGIRDDRATESTSRIMWGNGLDEAKGMGNPTIKGKLLSAHRPFVAQYLHLANSAGKFVLVINAHFPHTKVKTAAITASLKKQIGEVDASKVAAIFLAGDLNRAINPKNDKFEFKLKNGGHGTAILRLMHGQEATYFGWQRGYGKVKRAFRRRAFGKGKGKGKGGKAGLLAKGKGKGKGGKAKGKYNPFAKAGTVGTRKSKLKYGPDQMLFWVNDKLVDTKHFKAHFNVYRFKSGPGSDHLPIMGSFDIPLKK